MPSTELGLRSVHIPLITWQAQEDATGGILSCNLYCLSGLLFFLKKDYVIGAVRKIFPVAWH